MIDPRDARIAELEDWCRYYEQQWRDAERQLWIARSALNAWCVQADTVAANAVGKIDRRALRTGRGAVGAEQ